MSIINTNYYTHSNIIKQSLVDHNYGSVIFVIQGESNQSKRVQLFGSKKIRIIQYTPNILEHFTPLLKPVLIQQFNLTAIKREMKKQFKTLVKRKTDNILSKHKIYSTHFVQTGGLVTSDEKVHVLDNGSVHGKKKSLILLNDELFELPITGLNEPNTLNQIGEIIES